MVMDISQVLPGYQNPETNASKSLTVWNNVYMPLNTAVHFRLLYLLLLGTFQFPFPQNMAFA